MCADSGFLVLGAAPPPASTFVSEPQIVPLGQHLASWAPGHFICLDLLPCHPCKTGCTAQVFTAQGVTCRLAITSFSFYFLPGTKGKYWQYTDKLYRPCCFSARSTPCYSRTHQKRPSLLGACWSQLNICCRVESPAIYPYPKNTPNSDHGLSFPSPET